MKRTYVPQLTGLRGAAALLVVISHAADAGMAPAWLGDGFGKMGVMVFFVLSSYLMTTIYLDRPVSKSWSDYVLARIGRVFPLYLLLVGISVLVTPYVLAWRYQITDWSTVLESLLFLRAPQELWAVPVEVQFYVVFLGLWFIIESLWQKRRSPLSIGLLLTAVWLPLFGLAAWLRPDFNTLGHSIHFFLLGIVLGIWDAPLRKRLPGFLSGWGGVVLVLVLLLICAPYLRKASGTYLSVWIDPIVISSVLMVFLTARQGGRLADLLNTTVMQFLGRISYGFYLIHALVIYLLVDVMQGRMPLLGLVLVLGISAGLAKLSFHWFEQPTARVIRRLQRSAALRKA